ncbi:TetR-like C-terminal domain-containing protein [Herbiconiux ginsengi]|uniref:TetR-like C-terminal domain-containing protein n=1 Tax=Herbiconiux ginsengi TaxID=381665 RepID=UPI001C317EB1|nr:TetR-like C-terminal domain-containing protein [Herbiconiux ginsengi]
MHELAEAASTSLIDNLVQSLPQPGAGFGDDDGLPSLLAFFAELKEHAGLYRSLLGPTGSAPVTEHIRRRITEAVVSDSPERRDIYPEFVAGALLGVATAWLHADHPAESADVAQQTWRLLISLTPRQSNQPEATT